MITALEQSTGLKPTVDFPEEQEEPPIEETSAEPATPVPLSERTEQVVQKMFPASDQYEVRQLLINQCGTNIYGHEDQDEYELEQIRFAVLRMSKGNMKKFRHAILSALEDFRTPYSASGFEGLEGKEKMEKWVQSILGKD